MVHIFHHFDADGYASAAVIIKHYRKEITRTGMEIKTYSCKHGNPMDFSNVDTEKDVVFIVDYSFTDPRDVESVKKLACSFLEKAGVTRTEDCIFELRRRMIWIDHHASSKDIIDNDESGTLEILAKAGSVHPENIYAGCMLTWLYLNCPSYALHGKDLEAIKYYISQNCPIWVQFVDDYDKWAHKMEHSTEFVTGVDCTNGGLWNNFLNPDGSYATYISKNVDGVTKKFIKKGKVIEEYRKGENLRALMGAGFITEIVCDGMVLNVCCINKQGNSMLFGDYFKDFDAAIVYTYDGHLWNYSIFSEASKPFPVNKVAEMYKKKFGITGGGHQHAAGWATEKNIFDMNPKETNITEKRILFKDWLKKQK